MKIQRSKVSHLCCVGIFFNNIIFLVCCSTYVRNLHGITDWLNMAGGMGNYYVIQFWEKSLLMWFLCDTAQMCNSKTNTNTKKWQIERQIERQRQRHLDVVPDSGPKRAATPERNKWQTGKSKWLLIDWIYFIVFHLYCLFFSNIIRRSNPTYGTTKQHDGSFIMVQTTVHSMTCIIIVSPLFEAWKESSGGIFSIWAESLDELRIFPCWLIRSTAYLEILTFYLLTWKHNFLLHTWKC